MKTKKEIYEALIAGKTLESDTNGALIKLNKSGNTVHSDIGRENWGCYNETFSIPENWSIYEPPKEKKKYYQWKICDTNSKWYRPDSYLDGEGMNTEGKPYSFIWSTLEKIRIDDDYVEV